MMPDSNQSVDDQVLTAYLFGNLPTEETERLDELSIADDDFAARLYAVESDLVDAYAGGELSGTTLEKFERTYLSSPVRRQRVAVAKQLRLHVPPVANRVAEPESERSSFKRSSWLDIFRFPSFALAG